LWGGEVGDGHDVILARLHGVVGDFKACEFNFVFGESELLRVEGDAMSTAGIQPVGCLVEAFFYCDRP